MKEYIIKQDNKNEIALTFSFDKMSMVVSTLFSLILLGLIFFKIKFEVIKNIWGYLIILISMLFYLSFNKYFEWKKNRSTTIVLENDDIIINDQFYSKNEQIKSVNIVYSLNKFELGWTVYLKKHKEIENYIIKKRLRKEDAEEIASKISTFLDKDLVTD